MNINIYLMGNNHIYEMINKNNIVVTSIIILVKDLKLLHFIVHFRKYKFVHFIAFA